MPTPTRGTQVLPQPLPQPLPQALPAKTQVPPAAAQLHCKHCLSPCSLQLRIISLSSQSCVCSSWRYVGCWGCWLAGCVLPVSSNSAPGLVSAESMRAPLMETGSLRVYVRSAEVELRYPLQSNSSPHDSPHFAHEPLPLSDGAPPSFSSGLFLSATLCTVRLQNAIPALSVHDLFPGVSRCRS